MDESQRLIKCKEKIVEEEMSFNIIVKQRPWGKNKDSISSDRIFEFTDPLLIEKYKPNGNPDYQALAKLPTIFVEETSGPDQLVRIGRIDKIYRENWKVVIQYSYDEKIPLIKNQTFEKFSGELGIERQQFSRTHWSIKTGNLFYSILCNIQPRRPVPKVFKLNDSAIPYKNRISVMMPYSDKFDVVYDVIKKTALKFNMECKRADDISSNHAIIQDIVSLIDSSAMVVCDCSDLNQNVFYEMGIAHTLGREVFLITQSLKDIPFDIRHIRHFEYQSDGEGLDKLKLELCKQLSQL